ncbi:MAG: dephospho-CoA kinase [Micrococcaceae bacterium]
MFLIGLTGGIGAGKTTVSEILESKGAVVIQADEIARDVVKPGQPALENLVKEFGIDILNYDQTLNRAVLSQKAFTSELNVQKLNNITHPAIEKRTQQLFKKHSKDIVVFEHPLLVEQGSDKYPYDMIVAVQAPAAQKLHRLTELRGMDEQDAMQRMQMQTNDDQRAEIADIVIVNDGDEEQLEAVVNQLWEIIQERSISGE